MIFKRQEKASITIETSILLPICFYIFYTMFYFFILMRTEFVVYQGLLNVSDKLYAYGPEQAYLDNLNFDEYVSKKLNLGNEELAQKITKEGANILAQGISLVQMKGYLKEYFEDKGLTLSRIKGGIGGIDISSSRVMTDSSDVVLCARYTFNLPTLIWGMDRKLITTRLKINTFYGVDWEDTDEHKDKDDSQYVYIAKNGTVYHKDETCSYIKLNLIPVSISSVGGLRSSDGSIYYPCEDCGKKSNDGTVYILNYGTRYHTNKSCSKIKRDVTRVKIEDAEGFGRTPCFKCARSN